MNVQQLWLTAGLPGSGKSTHATVYAQTHNDVVVVSRDEIRFRYINSQKEYFKAEKTVFKQFVKEIQEALDEGHEIVIADATHLNNNSRVKLLNALHIADDVEVDLIVFDTPLEVAKQRNSQRTGLKRVPDDVIDSMATTFSWSENDSNFDYVKVITT